MRISFDFDGTLGDILKLQKLCKLLTLHTHAEIYILTSRFSEHRNDDLFKMAHHVGIKKKNVIICNGRQKSDIINSKSIDIHFEDDELEADVINLNTNCMCLLHNFNLNNILHYYSNT